MKILVVDDEILVRESVVMHLKDMGIFDIEEAGDGINAYEIIQSQKPDIVISDIRMPGITGIELLSKVSTTARDIIFILLSGYDLFEYAQAGINLGAFSYLLKPIKANELKEVIDRARVRLEEQNPKKKTSKQEKSSHQVIDLDSSKFHASASIIIDFKTEQLMLAGFEKCDKVLVTQLIKELYSPFTSNRLIEGPGLMKLNFQLILLIFKILDRLGIVPEEILGEEFILYDEVNVCNSIDDILLWFGEKLDICFDKITIIKEKSNNKLVEKAKEFIRINTGSDITLETVADHIHLSPTYLSKIFKQETGENFLDYVINCKISKAKDLLKEGTYKTNEISKLVGFKDVKYFYKVFKKITGFSPGRYKEI